MNEPQPNGGVFYEPYYRSRAREIPSVRVRLVVRGAEARRQRLRKLFGWLSYIGLTFE